MANLWERFDDIAKPEEVEEAKNEFTPVEEGTYNCIVEEIQASETKDNLPMVKGKFRMVENNRIIFYNQPLQNLNYPEMTARNIAGVVTLIGGIMGKDLDYATDVKTLGGLAELISTIEIGTPVTLKVFYGKKDLEHKFTQIKVVEAEAVVCDGVEVNEEDLPF